MYINKLNQRDFNTLFYLDKILSDIFVNWFYLEPLTITDKKMCRFNLEGSSSFRKRFIINHFVDELLSCSVHISDTDSIYFIFNGKYHTKDINGTKTVIDGLLHSFPYKDDHHDTFYISMGSFIIIKPELNKKTFIEITGDNINQKNELIVTHTDLDGNIKNIYGLPLFEISFDNNKSFIFGEGLHTSKISWYLIDEIILKSKWAKKNGYDFDLLGNIKDLKDEDLMLMAMSI